MSGSAAAGSRKSSRNGRRNGSIKVAGPVGAAFRDALIPLVTRLLYRKCGPQTWIFDHRVDAA